MDVDNLDAMVQWLKDALAISEFHFRDAVQELIEASKQEGGYREEEF